MVKKLIPTKISKRNLTLTVIVALLACTAHAETPPAHYQRACVECHARMTGGEGETLYQRKDRLVGNYLALRTRIEYCRRGSHVDWTAAQTQAVSDYLNHRFYFFPQVQ